MKKLAIIPARGGSKRIPRKNIKPFLGLPIISYSIKNALDSGLFDDVMVSTDDVEIAEIAKEYGASVPFMRSAANSDDFATTINVITEVIESYKIEGKEFDFASCIYPCTPLLSVEKLQESYEILQSEDLDCVFPIIRYGFPIQRALRVKNNLTNMIHPEHLTTRSQDLEPSYHDAGQFYTFQVENLVKDQRLVTDKTGFVILSEMEAQDIDNLIDWQLAELKYKMIYS